MPVVIGITIPGPAKEVIVDVPVIKEWWAIKIETMKNPGRDLLVMLKHNYLNQQSIQEEVKILNVILHQAESPHQFCKAHELVDRNYITTSVSKILKTIRKVELRPFRFLINKN